MYEVATYYTWTCSASEVIAFADVRVYAPVVEVFTLVVPRCLFIRLSVTSCGNVIIENVHLMDIYRLV